MYVILLIGLRFVGICLASRCRAKPTGPGLGFGLSPPGAMETVAWVCEFCNGESGKPQASENSRRCTSNKKPWNCRDALTEARTRERGAQGHQGRLKRARVQLQGQPSAYAAIIAEKNIYRIDEVYGVSFFDLDAIREDNVLRNGIEADEREYQYLVTARTRRLGFCDEKWGF